MSDTYINRMMTPSIVEAAKYFPVVTLTGPRQSGKSTLLRHIYNELPYFSMEDPDTRMTVSDDPRGFLLSFKDGVIIDEIQNMPVLLSYIQGIVDANPQLRYYLTGSANFSLLKNVSQSLAGRTAIFELLPLSLDELTDPTNDIDELLYTGFYPSVWAGKNLPRLLYPNYVKTYLERDVRDLLNIKDLDLFQRFIRLCAARIGSIFNASELSNELGIAVNTVNSWISVLQASYIIYMLPPFFTNTRKRLTKSPKIYFTDCGLAAFLLGIDSPSIMARDKIRGHLFENMIITNFLKDRYNQGKDPQMYFYRDSNGNEVDLLIKCGNSYSCYEIKSSSTFHPDFTKGLLRFSTSFPDLTNDLSVIYSGPDLPTLNGIHIKNFHSVLVPTPLLGRQV